MGGERRGKQRRQRRHRSVHQPGKPRLHVLQHEYPLARAVLLVAHAGTQDLVGQFGRDIFVALFQLGKIAEQLAHADVAGLLGGLCVKTLGLELHRLGFLADGVERQVTRQPDRAAAQESLDVGAPDRRQVGTETRLIHLQQHVAMAFFFFRHLLEQLCGIRVALGEVLREAHIDAAVLLLAGNGDREHFPLG